MSCCTSSLIHSGNSQELETLAIREMRPEDLPTVLLIDRVSSSSPWSERMFLDELTHPYASCYVLTKGTSAEEILAYICFRIIGKESEVLNLCVSPSYRRQGLGRKLMEFYLSRCVSRGIERSYLEVCLSNDGALRLYRSLLYEVVGRRKGFYQGRFDALTMRKTFSKREAL